MKLNDKLWDEWKRLVYKVAKKRLIFLTPFGYELDDVVQVGAIGLIKGMDNYREELKCSKITFLYKYVDQEILRELQSLKRDKRIVNKNIMSLETPAGSDTDEIILLDSIRDSTINIEKSVEDKMMQKFILCEMKSCLSELEYKVLYLRYFMNFTVKEVYIALSLRGKYHVEQIQTEAKRSLITKSVYFKKAYDEFKVDVEAKIDFKYKRSAEDVVMDRLTILNKFNLFKDFELN